MQHIWGGGAPATWGVPSTEGGLNSQRETNDRGQWEMEEDATTAKIATAWTSTCLCVRDLTKKIVNANS